MNLNWFKSVIRVPFPHPYGLDKCIGWGSLTQVRGIVGMTSKKNFLTFFYWLNFLFAIYTQKCLNSEVTVFLTVHTLFLNYYINYMCQIVLLLQRQFIWKKGRKCLLIHRKTWAGVLDGMVEIQWPWDCYTMRKAKTHGEVTCSNKKTWLNPDLGPDITIWMKEVPDIHSFQMFETPSDICVFL